MNVQALCTGLTFGLMTYLFGHGSATGRCSTAISCWRLFMLTWGHLRHSHIWMPFQRSLWASCSRARRTTRCIIRPTPAISTRTSASRWRCGTGRSARCTSLRASARCANMASARNTRITRRRALAGAAFRQGRADAEAAAARRRRQGSLNPRGVTSGSSARRGDRPARAADAAFAAADAAAPCAAARMCPIVCIAAHPRSVVARPARALRARDLSHSCNVSRRIDDFSRRSHANGRSSAPTARPRRKLAFVAI